MAQRDFMDELSVLRKKVDDYTKLEDEATEGLDELGVAVMTECGVDEIVFNTDERIGFNHENNDVITYFHVNNVTVKNKSLYIGCSKCGDGTFEGYFLYLSEVMYLDERRSIVEGIMKKLGYKVKKHWNEF